MKKLFERDYPPSRFPNERMNPFTKFILQLLAFLAIVGILIICALFAPVYLLLLFSISFFSVTVMMGIGIKKAMATGELPGRGSTTYRYRSPANFTIGIMIYIIMSLTTLAVSLMLFVAFLRTINGR